MKTMIKSVQTGTDGKVIVVYEELKEWWEHD
jgi:hypothetical protein